MKTIALIPFLLGLAIPAFAESTNPQLVDGSMPAYTDAARSNGIEGIVIVEALVDEQGRVFAADVVQSVSPELDALTLEAVKTWKFTPATENGKAIMKVVRIPVNFNLIDPMDQTVLKAQDAAVAAR
jgi:protein TonB